LTTLNFCNCLIFVGECKAILTMPCSYDSNASQKISQKQDGYSMYLSGNLFICFQYHLYIDKLSLFR